MLSRTPIILSLLLTAFQALPAFAATGSQAEPLPAFLEPIVSDLCAVPDAARSEQEIARDLRFYDFLLADRMISPESIASQIYLAQVAGNDLILGMYQRNVEDIKIFSEMVNAFQSGHEFPISESMHERFDPSTLTNFLPNKVVSDYSFERFSKNLTLQAYQQLSAQVVEAFDKIPETLKRKESELRSRLVLKERIPSLESELEFVKSPPNLSLPTKIRLKLFNKAIRPTMSIFGNPGFKSCGLSTAEMLSLEMYTGQVYIELNQALWKGGSLIDKYKPFMDVLNSALLKLRAYEGTVLRGVDLPAAVVKDYQVGQVISYPTYLSTSLTSGFTGKRNNFTLRSRSGRYIGIYARSFYENEVLFAPNTKFKVLERKDLDANRVDFIMEEMP